MSVTVITATLPEREPLLREAIASVAAQTVKPTEHLIAVDYVRRGGARVFNLLAAAATTEWLAILPDDDLLYPHHLASLTEVSADADIVYSWCDVSGAHPWEQYNRPFDPDILRRMSIVSHVALVRTQVVRDLGGWDEVQGYDWLFWVKALDAGARFRCVEHPTWHYRLETDWRHESRGGVA